jgi:hypothetical protein
MLLPLLVRSGSKLRYLVAGAYPQAGVLSGACCPRRTQSESHTARGDAQAGTAGLASAVPLPPRLAVHWHWHAACHNDQQDHRESLRSGP